MARRLSEEELIRLERVVCKMQNKDCVWRPENSHCGRAHLCGRLGQDRQLVSVMALELAQMLNVPVEVPAFNPCSPEQNMAINYRGALAATDGDGSN